MSKKIFKTIYKLIPLKAYLFRMLRAIYTPKQSFYRHLHFKGIIQVKVDEHKSFRIRHHGYMIENDLFWAGINNGWEKISLKYWIELSKQSTVIVDVGANTGVYSLVAKTVNPESSVYAFEPIDRNFIKLEENCKLNNYSIHCEKSALSDTNGKAVVYEEKKNDVIYSVTVNKSLVEMTSKVEETSIDVVRLDTFIEKHNISQIDLIKIDVETHEPEVLQGFGKYMNQFQPTMLIEILNDEVAAKVQELIKDIPYLYFNIDENTGIRKVNSLSKSDYFNFLLCKQDIAEKLKLV